MLLLLSNRKTIKMVYLFSFATSLALLCLTSSAYPVSSELSSEYTAGLRKNHAVGQQLINVERTAHAAPGLQTSSGTKEEDDQTKFTMILVQEKVANASRFLEGEGDHEDEEDHEDEDHEDEDHDHEDEDHEDEDHEDEDHDHEEDEDHDHGDSASKPWGIVLLSTLIVNFATITGVIFLIPVFKAGLEGNGTSRSVDVLIPAFAAGALIATVAFLTLPEGIAKIQGSLMEEEDEHHDDHDADHIDDHDLEDEVTGSGAGAARYLRFLEGDDTGHEDHGFELYPSTIWRFATSLLAGFLIPICLAMFFPRPEVTDLSSIKEAKELNDSKKETALEADVVVVVSEPQKIPLNIPLILSVLIGDFCHNFADGIFIGTAFMLCDNTKAWVITSVTLYHEIAQEIADYFILTRIAGLKPVTALVLNFVSGFSVILGGITILAGNFGEMGIGVFMSIASGTYLYIAAVECLPRAISGAAKDAKTYLLLVLLFIVGVVPIGLTLLNHSHCEEEGHDNHADH